jgi:hypothetical protein
MSNSHIEVLSDLIKWQIKHGLHDITAVLNTEQMGEIATYVNFREFDEVQVCTSGEAHLVSSLVGKKKYFIVEPVFDESGETVYNETDVLIIPHDVHSDVLEGVLQSAFKLVIKLEEDASLESLTTKLIELRH